jgi:hypothetical protein
MQNPTDQAEASIPTETVREGPNYLNYTFTFTLRRKAAKRSEAWYQTTATPLPPPPQAEVIPARKKRRLNEPILRTTSEANYYENAELVSDTPPNTGANEAMGRWTPEEDAVLTNAVAKTEKKLWGKEYKMDWVAIAALVTGRREKQCSQRWRHFLDPRIALTAGSVGKWTEDEDLKLKHALQMHGGKDWGRIARWSRVERETSVIRDGTMSCIPVSS